MSLGSSYSGYMVFLVQKGKEVWAFNVTWMEYLMTYTIYFLFFFRNLPKAILPDYVYFSLKVIQNSS